MMQKYKSQEQCNINTTRVKLDLQESLDLQCKNCRLVIAPLSALTHYLQILTLTSLPKQMFVLAKFQFMNLKVNKEDKYMIKEGPFEYMYLIPIKCGQCNEVLGQYFHTVNIFGNLWLYQRHLLNTEKVMILEDERNLVKTLIGQIQRVVPQYEGSVQPYNEELHIIECLKRQEEQIEKVLSKHHDVSNKQTREAKLKEYLKLMKNLDNKMQILSKKMMIKSKQGQYYQRLVFNAVDRQKHANKKQKMKQIDNQHDKTI